MKIILLKDVKKVGLKNQVKEVSNGYAQFLIGQGKAEMATPSKVREAEKFTSEMTEKKSQTEDAIRTGVGKISKSITISVKTNEKGHLFEAVRNELIAKDLSDKIGIHIEAQSIQHDEPIKDVGEYTVSLLVGDDVIQLIVIIVSQ